MKISIIGHFAYGRNFLDGQTVKTKSLYEALCNEYGASEIVTIDTYGIKKKIFMLPFMLMKALRKSKNVLILPAHNGVKIIVPLLHFLNKFYKRKLHYSVVGGWLPEFLNDRPKLEKKLKLFEGLYVETNTMRLALEVKGFKNVFVVPNFKKLDILAHDELVCDFDMPYKLCTFSRVMREKGIETAINVIKEVNEKLGCTAYSLDIYGPVDPSQTEWFGNLQSKFPDYVKYCGCVDSNKSVDVLKEYFALLFPTHFYTEGIPGTIIDAYAAGVPVISARWESFADVVDDGVTGLSYEFDNNMHFVEILLDIFQHPQKFVEMRKNSILKAELYTPQTVTKIISEKLV